MARFTTNHSIYIYEIYHSAKIAKRAQHPVKKHRKKESCLHTEHSFGSLKQRNAYSFVSRSFLLQPLLCFQCYAEIFVEAGAGDGSIEAFP